MRKEECLAEWDKAIRKDPLQKSDLSSLTEGDGSDGGVGVCVKEEHAFHGWAVVGEAEGD